MTAEGSYRLSDHGDADLEIGRLREQALLGWPQEARFLEDRGVHRAEHILEVGAGPGFVTEQLLALAPNARVTALDNDPEMIQRARTLLGDHPRVGHLEASVTETGLPDRSVDACYARLVFQHLPDPQAAALELFRLTRAGGTVTVLDVDDGLWGLLDPPLPVRQDIFEAIAEVQSQRGGDRTIGRKLWRMLDRAGFEDLELRLVSAHSDAVGVEPFIRTFGGRERLEPLVQAGLLDADVVEEGERYRDRFREGGYALLVLFAVSGRRPAD